jgi:hypothetical protein
MLVSSGRPVSGKGVQRQIQKRLPVTHGACVVPRCLQSLGAPVIGRCTLDVRFGTYERSIEFIHSLLRAARGQASAASPDIHCKPERSKTTGLRHCGERPPGEGEVVHGVLPIPGTQEVKTAINGQLGEAFIEGGGSLEG